eukprot:4599076-Amphidinium_carterae.2
MALLSRKPQALRRGYIAYERKWCCGATELLLGSGIHAIGKKERAGKARKVPAQGASTAWQKKHDDVRKKENCVDVPPWSGTATLQWPGLESKRVLDVINLAWQVTVKKIGADVLNPFKLFVDVSQSGHHKPWVYGKLRSITTSSVIFNFGAKRCLLPEETFAILGFDGVDCSTLSGWVKKDLVGECMALPSIAMCLSALCSALQPNELTNG